MERAPWWGGVFERMIKSTKRCLRKLIGKANLTYDELLTAFAEVEVVVNFLLLSYISSDHCSYAASFVNGQEIVEHTRWSLLQRREGLHIRSDSRIAEQENEVSEYNTQPILEMEERVPVGIQREPSSWQQAFRHC